MGLINLSLRCSKLFVFKAVHVSEKNTVICVGVSQNKFTCSPHLILKKKSLNIDDDNLIKILNFKDFLKTLLLCY